MKFLIITDDSGNPPEKAYVNLEATQRWIDELRDKGVLEHIYSLAGNHGTAMIVNVDSAEHLDEITITSTRCEPVTIVALADYGQAMKRMSAHFKHTLASMKGSQ